jgi:hypothetical protein
MNIKRWLGIVILFSVAIAPCVVTAQPPQVKRLTATEAKNHIGERATVCGKVASARYAATTRGKPTFLNLDEPYPSQVFTVLIWGQNRAKFGAPEEHYRGKQICVTGTITEYRKAPEFVVSDPQSIVIEK